MPDTFTRIKRFFEGFGSVLSTPSGDARGHVHDRVRTDLTKQDLPDDRRL